MTKPKILIQLDPDQHASVFDAVVAIDAGVDQLLQYSNVESNQVTPLVHWYMARFLLEVPTTFAIPRYSSVDRMPHKAKLC
jgi:hypothetical protein